MNQTPLRKVDIGEDDRREGLGGSDSPVVLGVSPFTTRQELWLEKMGLTEGKKSTPAMDRGNFLEEPVAQLYSKVTGRRVEVVKQRLIHPKHPFIYAHIDRRIWDEKKGPGVLEIKCPGMSYFRKNEAEGLQEYYIVQLQHYLGVTGLKWGSFIVFNAEYMQYITFDVVPDQKLIEIIFQEDEKFWQMVQQGIEPEEAPVKIDSDEMKARAGLSPSELTNMDKINPVLWAEIIKRYQEAKQLKDDSEAYLDLCEQKIKEEMERAQATVAEGSGARIYWREQDGRKTLDKKAFAKGNILAYQIYESFMKTGKPSRPFRAYFPRPIHHE